MYMMMFHKCRATIPALIFTLSLVFTQEAKAVDITRLWPVAGIGTMVKETRDVGVFRALKLSTSARVIVRQGNGNSVAVEAESNVTPLIDAYVENGTLVVEDFKHFKSPNAAVVITARHISSIRTTGDVAVTVESLRASALSVSMGGTSAVTLNSVAVNRLSAALGEKSALKVSGVADDFSAEIGGSSALRAIELEAKSVSVNGGGSAQATVWARDSLSISLGGSAGVNYFGNLSPTLATSGSATVRHLGNAPQVQR